MTLRAREKLNDLISPMVELLSDASSRQDSFPSIRRELKEPPRRDTPSTFTAPLKNLIARRSAVKKKIFHHARSLVRTLNELTEKI